MWNAHQSTGCFRNRSGGLFERSDMQLQTHFKTSYSDHYSFNYVNALIMCSIDLSIKHRNILQPNVVAVCFCRQSLNRLIFVHSFICQNSDDSNLKSGILIKLFHLSCISDQMPVKWWFMFWSIKQPRDPWIDSSNKCVEI